MSSYIMATRVAVLNMLVNLLLAVGKCSVGWMTSSAALLSDGVHSVADSLSSLAVIVGIRLSAKKADSSHPYGCERLECVAAIVLSMVVTVSGIGIGAAAVRTMIYVTETNGETLGYAWVTAVMAILVKEGMYRYTKWTAVRCGSAALMADAWHQRTDALSSLGSLIGILGAKCGFPMLDPLAGVLIALLILKAAYDIFSDAVRKMVDHACDTDLQRRVEEYVNQLPGVMAVQSMRTRLFANQVLVEITVRISCGQMARDAYGIAQSVQRSVEDEFDEIKGCSVHIHPSEIPLAPLQNG